MNLSGIHLHDLALDFLQERSKERGDKKLTKTFARETDLIQEFIKYIREKKDK